MSYKTEGLGADPADKSPASPGVVVFEADQEDGRRPENDYTDLAHILSSQCSQVTFTPLLQ